MSEPGAIAAASIEPGRRLRVVGPSLRDPRLHVAAVILALQVLGQTVLDFRLSVAQILICLVAGAAIEVSVVLVRDRTLIWPASGLLTGNSAAFILRTPGTLHGQWWSLNGIWIFLAVVAISMASKYLVRWRGRHIFNPSNLGLVLAFAVLGPRFTEPQDLWWIPLGPWLLLTYAILVVGGLLVAWELRLLLLELGFMAGFAAAALLAIVLVPDHCLVASWHATPLCGGDLWQLLVTSPEVLVFAFFMVPDPKTVPRAQGARLVFGIGVGVLAAVMLGPATLEFWTKTAILASLVIACAGRFALEALLTAESPARRQAGWLAAMATLVLGLYVSPIAADAGARGPQPAAELADGTTPSLALTIGNGPGPAAWAQRAAADGLPAAGALAPHPSPGTARIWVLPAIPTVSVPSNVAAFDHNMTPARAASMAHDAVFDLLVEAEARRSHDATLARTGAEQDALKDTTDAIGRDTAAGQSVQQTFTFDRAGLQLYLPKYSTQAPRLVGVELHGTVTTVVSDAAGRELSRNTSEYARSWGLGILSGTPAHQVLVVEYTGLQPA